MLLNAFNTLSWDKMQSGHVVDIIHDLQLVEEDVSLIGLRLNHSKTELICDDASTRSTVFSVTSKLQVTDHEQATLVGTLIGGLGLIDNTITSKINKLTIMGERLLHLPHQDALLILRNSLAISKLKFFAFSVLHPAFSLHDYKHFMGPLNAF